MTVARACCDEEDSGLGEMGAVVDQQARPSIDRLTD